MEIPSKKEIESFRYLAKVQGEVYRGMLKIYSTLPQVVGSALKAHDDQNGSIRRSGMTSKGLITTHRLTFKKPDAEEFEMLDVVYGKSADDNPMISVSSTSHDPIAIPVSWDLNTDSQNVLDTVAMWVGEILK
jgi:hypothetical protein